MLKWIKERLKEPSTYQGLAGFLALLGAQMEPELIKEIGGVAVGIITVIQMVKKEYGRDNKGSSKQALND